MKTHENEVMVLYDSASNEGRKTLAYAHTLTPNVKGWDYSLLPLTTTLWKQLLDMLQVHPKELLDKSHPYYQSHIRGHEFDEEGWLNVLRKNTFLIKSPIAVKGNKAVLCTTPQDIFCIVQGNVQEASPAGRLLKEPEA
jgi:arsenate reductase